MARDKGQIYAASDWFKDALQISQVRNQICLQTIKCIGCGIPRTQCEYDIYRKLALYFFTNISLRFF